MRTNHIYIHDISGQAIVNFGNVGRICPMSATKETAGSGSANETNHPIKAYWMLLFQTMYKSQKVDV